MDRLTEMVIPEISSFEQLIDRAKQKVINEKKCRAALLTAADTDTLQAFKRTVTEGLVEPIMLGSETSFNEACRQMDFPPDRIRYYPAEKNDEAVSRATRLVAEGEIDLLINGRIPVADMLGILFKTESNFIVKGKVVSHVAVIKPRQYKKLLLLSDSAVVVQVDLKTKLQLIDNLIKVAEKIGINHPRIAVLAAVEVIYPQMPVTMEAAILAKMSERRQIKGAYVDGPLSFDIAVDMFAAHSKGIRDSEVAGQADALLAPSIETANGIYKAVSLYAHCPMGGVIVGGRVPIALISRSDSIDNKYHSIVLGVLNS